jgi:3'-5' exoribonuclease
MIDRRILELKASGVAVDPETVMQLQHIIVSHHGCLEHGSPKVPMTLEAITFHYLDEMDAKLSSARAMVMADRTKDRWTPYNPTIGRKILKPTN